VGGSEACSVCIEDSCSTELEACSPDCMDYGYCLDDCPEGDGICESECQDLYPWGVSEFLEVTSCVSLWCEGECL
jgi:hypothetical protein